MRTLVHPLRTVEQEHSDAARRDAVARAEALDAARADGLLALQRAADELSASDAARKEAVSALEGDLGDMAGALRAAQEHADAVRLCASCAGGLSSWQ